MPRESKKARSERAARVYDLLASEHPDARTALVHENPYQLVVATILSAQCTDERVNAVTPALFGRWPTAADLARGKSDNPLPAASQQQEVADGASQLSKRSPADVAQPLAQASRNAAEAARDPLDAERCAQNLPSVSSARRFRAASRSMRP